MPLYECPECGDQRVEKNWPRCEKHSSSIGMYQIVDEGKLATKIKVQKDPLKSGE